MIIGITGSFGSGKTTVAKMFGRLGAYIIDADKLCHSLIAPRGKLYKDIVKHFGERILQKDRAIHRRKLGQLVFKKRSKLILLDRLIHPEVIKEIQRIIKEKKRKIIVIDAPLLVESLFYKKVAKLIVVRANRDAQIDRIVRSKGMTKKEILERIKMQAPLKKKLALADFVIDNSGSRKETLLQIRKIWKQIGADYV